MKKARCVEMKLALKWLQINLHPNLCCPQLKHVPVLQQNRGPLCGYHTLYNAKCMARALITDSKYTQMVNLCSLTSDRDFWSHYRRTVQLLLDCDDQHYVSETDKREAVKGAALERIHMQYLISIDPELDMLINNKEGARVWIDVIEYTFGRFMNNNDHIIRIHNKIAEFQHSKEESVFIFFVGAVNHWVAFVAHKAAWNDLSKLK
jgi:hypothetical protein